jgi:peptidoglycan hydrolase CwlO-like protein
MTQATDTDIRALKDLMLGIGTEIKTLKDTISAVDNSIKDLKSDVRVMDARLIEVEKKIDKQDTRLWAFVGVILTIALGALSTIGVRYIFLTNP